MTWFYYQLTIEDVLKTAPLINDARRRLSRQHLDSLVERVTKVMNRIEVWNIHRTFCEIVRHNDDYTVIEYANNEVFTLVGDEWVWNGD